MPAAYHFASPCQGYYHPRYTVHSPLDMQLEINGCGIISMVCDTPNLDKRWFGSVRGVESCHSFSLGRLATHDHPDLQSSFTQVTLHRCGGLQSHRVCFDRASLRAFLLG